jgi:hypothetical protein
MDQRGRLDKAVSWHHSYGQRLALVVVFEMESVSESSASYLTDELGSKRAAILAHALQIGNYEKTSDASSTGNCSSADDGL